MTLRPMLNNQKVPEQERDGKWNVERVPVGKEEEEKEKEGELD